MEAKMHEIPGHVREALRLLANHDSPMVVETFKLENESPEARPVTIFVLYTTQEFAGTLLAPYQSDLVCARVEGVSPLGSNGEDVADGIRVPHPSTRGKGGM